MLQSKRIRLLVLTCQIFSTIAVTIEKSMMNQVDNDLAALQHKNINCSSASVVQADKFRISGRTNKALACYLRVIKSNPDNAVAWIGAAESIKQTSKKLSKLYFKQAAEFLDVLYPPNNWYFFGPFIMGKTEVDGDPIEYLGGIEAIAKYRLFKKRVSFPSEIMKSVNVTWTKLAVDDDGVVNLAPKAEFKNLVNQLSSLGVLEWQGWAVAELLVATPSTVSVRCGGISLLYVSGVPVAGDLYKRTQFTFSLSLSAGIHLVLARLRGRVFSEFRCDFGRVSTDLVILSPPQLPDLVDGHVFGSHVSLPLINRHAHRWLSDVRVSTRLPLHVTVMSDPLIAPGQVGAVVLKLTSDQPVDCSQQHVQLQLKLTSSIGNNDFSLRLQCRRVDQSLLLTFIDHDGSVQSAAVIPPRLHRTESSEKRSALPVVLSLHGTGVGARDQADSYKRAGDDDQFVFGFDHMWLLAPTRHGAHNWEGPGALTALTSLKRLEEITQTAKWTSAAVDVNKLIYVGHSMGGHGTLHLATHFPDPALAVVVLAGWIKKEEYGDSNFFFQHDISTSDVDPAVKQVLESCITGNNADLHATNLKGVPVLMRVGELDSSVPPYYCRRMYRVLRQAGVNVTYHELKGKEHWWWDTRETNDGGATNDAEIREFTERYGHVIPGSQSTDNDITGSSAQCGESGCKEEQRYTQLHNIEFTVTAVDLVFTGSVRGVRILRQKLTLRTSRIRVRIFDGICYFSTSNIESFSLQLAVNRAIDWSQCQSLIIDQTTVAAPEWDQQNTHAHKQSDTSAQIDMQAGTPIGDVHITRFCSKDPFNWSVCQPVARRSLSQLGPARTIAEKPFDIVIADRDMRPYSKLRHDAVFLANQFWLTSDLQVSLYNESSYTHKENVIVLGTPEDSVMVEHLLKRLPLNWTSSGVGLGSCWWPAPVSVLTLAPQASHLALLLIHSPGSTRSMNPTVLFSNPTIPPMARSPFSNLVPDFVLLGSEVGASGPAGYLCAGSWGNDWELVPQLISCAC